MTANPYGVSTIHETCRCGAEFNWKGDTWLGKCAVEKFRRDHAECRGEAPPVEHQGADGA